MLVISRREKDRILFPSLGISVEVVRLTSNRAALGIKAPTSIRVLRHELAQKRDHCPTADGLAEAMEAKIYCQLKRKVDRIIASLESVQADLKAGDTDDAVETLAQTLARLDALRAQADASNEDADRDGWAASETVAEPGGNYAVDRSDIRNVLVVQPSHREPNALMSDLVSRNIDVHVVHDPFVALYHLAKVDRPDLVLIADDPESAFHNETVQWLRACDPGSPVPIIATDEFRAHPMFDDLPAPV